MKSQKKIKANKTVIITGGNSGLGFECAKTSLSFSIRETIYIYLY
jgi:short-subunit dehydrogenase involved in D-alanine esterification of teichoic acids